MSDAVDSQRQPSRQHLSLVASQDIPSRPPLILLLHSGGLDSHICWLMHPDWQPVYIAHGSGNETAELDALDTLHARDPRFYYTVVEAGLLLCEDDGHMPYRNLLL